VPSGLRDAYLRVIRKAGCVTVVLEDTPDNIVQRIVFYDIDSRPIDKTLTEADKALYCKEIAGDLAFFRKSYERADLRIHIGGLDAPASAERISERLASMPRGAEAAAG
jgi:shikimate kinase